MSEIFTIKVLPQSDEIFIGYVARLSYRNGFSSIRKFLKVVNINYNKSTFCIGTENYNHLASALATGLQMDENKFKNLFKDQELLSKHVNKYVSTSHINRLRLCAKCFIKETYVKAEWMHYHTGQCTKHNCNLVNECPKCKHHFNWSGKLFKGCTHCGTTWEEIVAEPTPTVAMSSLTC